MGIVKTGPVDIDKLPVEERWQRRMHVAWQKRRPHPMPRGVGQFNFYTDWNTREVQVWRNQGPTFPGCILGPMMQIEAGELWEGAKAEVCNVSEGAHPCDVTQQEADIAVQALFERLEPAKPKAKAM